MQQVKTYRFKLAPTPTQREALGQWVGACRYVYNLCLDYKKTLFEGHGRALSKNECQKELAVLCKEVPWLRCLHSQTVQDVTDRLFLAYDTFFRDHKSGKIDELKRAYLRTCQRKGRVPNPVRLSRMGKVNFARKGDYQSFAFKQGVKLDERSRRLQLPKLGKIKYRNSQFLPADAVIKRAVIREQADGWYVSLSVETAIPAWPVAPNVRVGVDVGLTELATLSTGEKIANPRPLKQAQWRLARAQRAVSRQQKGSQNRRKAVHKLARAHQRVRNVRQDGLHKLTTRLLRENQAVITEQLAITNLVKNHHLARRIHDAAWGELNRQLAYKAVWYGRHYEQVAPQHTSQDCSVCGLRNRQLTLAVRVWTCPACGSHLDWDENAAVNIQNKSVGHTRLACQVYDPVAGVGQESPSL